MRRLLLLLLLAGCTDSVDTSGLPSIDGYESWDELTLSGKIPGHGDGVRCVFANDKARTYPHGGRYPVGTVLVKEIYDEGADCKARTGDLEYIAIMRKLTDLPTEDGAQHGWLFTFKDDKGSSEVRYDPCWSGCHKQAPFDGAWLDYGQ